MNNATNRNPVPTASNSARSGMAGRGGNRHYKTRSGKAWSGSDIARLILMAERQVPAKRIAAKLRRSEGAVRAEAARQHVLLAPSDKGPMTKRPYGGVSGGAVRAPRDRRAPSLSRARAQAPSPQSVQDTLF